MTNEDQIRDEKLQHDINREAAKISALSWGKIDKYEYLTGEEILPSTKQHFINKIREGEINLNEAKEEQAKLKSSIGEIKSTKKIFIKRK